AATAGPAASITPRLSLRDAPPSRRAFSPCPSSTPYVASCRLSYQIRARNEKRPRISCSQLFFVPAENRSTGRARWNSRPARPLSLRERATPVTKRPFLNTALNSAPPGPAGPLSSLWISQLQPCHRPAQLHQTQGHPAKPVPLRCFVVAHLADRIEV